MWHILGGAVFVIAGITAFIDAHRPTETY